MPRSPPSQLCTPPSVQGLRDGDGCDNWRTVSAQPTTASKGANASLHCVFSPGSEFSSDADESGQMAHGALSPRLLFVDLPSRYPAGGPALPLRRLLDYDQRPQVLCAGERMKKYVCRYCGEVLTAGCALGGHVTKFHSAQLRRARPAP